MKDKKYWVWLSRIEGLGSIKINKLLQQFQNPENIWHQDEEELKKVEGIGEILAKKICDENYKNGLDRYIEYMEKYNIDIITIEDEEYPNKLKNIYDPPVMLYIKGNKKILQDFSISMIGCRQCSTYGKKVANDLAYELSQKGINIVSGLATGIDSFAHIGCIKAKGKTIAVLGNGLDRVYPKENIGLFNEIVKTGGAIISEYVIGTRPERMNFPARNRIVSGLSNGVIVIEAKEKSGTLITVDFAQDQGKDVFVVPGNITSPNSKGTNSLIKEGAKIVTCVEDVLEEYNNFKN